MIDEFDRVGLRMLFINLKSPDTGCIVDGGILEAANLFAFIFNESQGLDVHLDVMARHLLVIPLGVDFAASRAARQPVETMAFEDAVDGCI